MTDRTATQTPAQPVITEDAPANAPAPGMKKVTITIAALTRCSYTTEIEVPLDADDSDIREYADEIYDEVDGGDFEDDPDYWERGETTWEYVDEEGEAA